MSSVQHYAIFLIPLILLLVILFFIFSRCFVYIANDKIGIQERLWSRKGSNKSGFISLNGETGYLPEILRGGPHLFPPFQYRVHKCPIVIVPQGSIGYVFARGGAVIPTGQTLAKAVAAPFEDTRAFLTSGGQQGPQRKILREGMHFLNLAEFVVFTTDSFYSINMDKDNAIIKDMETTIRQRNGFTPVVIKDQSDSLGVVTVHEGPALDHEEIIAPTVGASPDNPESFHNSFQDPEKFLAAGGRRGRQEQVLVEGTYFINRLFATIEIREKTIIGIGEVGVVISYTGKRGTDLTSDAYKHGELVNVGERGVWQTSLQPGKYALNPDAYHVITVPTTNFVLRWIKGRTEDHKLDSGLSEITLITKDAFEPILPLSIVLHIPYDKAPRVIQQFASVKLLVEQTLDPMVSAYFKDAAQNENLLELIGNRAELQQSAKAQMKLRFLDYDLDLQEVMLGTPRPQDGDMHIATVLDQLRVRQVAREKLETYKSQQTAAEQEFELRAAESKAANQGRKTQSEIDINIAENNGRAMLATRTNEAAAIKVLAESEAYKTRLEGEAEGSRIQSIGLATAASTEAQVKAYGGAELQLRKEIAATFGVALANATVPLIPSVVITGNGDQSSNPSMVEALLAMILNNQKPTQ
jgi:uncharacterized membrane protein YqiK